MGPGLVAFWELHKSLPEGQASKEGIRIDGVSMLYERMFWDHHILSTPGRYFLSQLTLNHYVSSNESVSSKTLVIIASLQICEKLMVRWSCQNAPFLCFSLQCTIKQRQSLQSTLIPEL